MYEFIVKGGVVMIPIIGCSVVALGVFLERLWSLRKRKVIPSRFLRNIEELVRLGKIAEARALSRGDDSPIAKILSAAMKNHGKNRAVIKESVEEVGRKEAADLEKYLRVLETIASISTLLGFLGTISGMIKIFNVISVQGVGNPSTLAGGIAEALITTFAGLSIAIPVVVAHRYLLSKVDSRISDMESYSIEMVEMLKGEEK